MNKLIFLDVDGVLNKIGTKERSPHGTYGVEQNLIEKLKKIVDETQAEIVLSSTWRKYHDLKAYLYRELYKNGIEQRIYSCTPSFSYLKKAKINHYEAKNRGKILRCDEIRHYMNENPCDRFVIIDDDYDAGVGFKENFVHIDIMVGITDQDVEKAINILNKDNQ